MVTRLRTLIVDDEPLAARRLAIILGARDDVELIGTARDGEEALIAIAEKRPDLVLLDVEMPGIDGFEVVERLDSEVSPIVVFVTAFDHYAAKAFEARALDYLVKPVEAERLEGAIAHARDHHERREAESQLAELREIVANLRRAAARGLPASAPRYLREFWVRSLGQTHRVPVNAVHWIQAERDYVRLHTADRSYLAREPISGLETRLDPDHFVRIHRSAIVRRDAIAALCHAEGRRPRIRLASGDLLSVGRSYVAALSALKAG